MSGWLSSDNTNNSKSDGNKKGEGTGSIKDQADHISKEAGKNSVTLPDGTRVDLKCRGHTEKSTGEKVETPHTHDPGRTNINPNTGEAYPTTKKVPRPTTQEDIDKVNNHLNKVLRQCYGKWSNKMA